MTCGGVAGRSSTEEARAWLLAYDEDVKGAGIQMSDSKAHDGTLTGELRG